MQIRLMEGRDLARVREIFEAQGLDVHLPLPGEDPAVVVAAVAEEDGVVVAAVIARTSVEAHLVIARGDPGAPRKVERLVRFAEGAVAAVGRHQRSLGFATYEDVVAVVPEGMSVMQRLMSWLGFIREPTGYVAWYKKLGA